MLTLVQDLKSICAAVDEPLVCFETLKTVRAVEKHLLPLEPLLQSIHNTLSEVKVIKRKFGILLNDQPEPSLVIEAALSDLQKEALSYKEHATHLSKRAQSTAQSISDILNLNFQKLAQGQSHNTFTLAQSAREDSVAIKALTLITSFYLPFSFVAVSPPL